MKVNKINRVLLEAQRFIKAAKTAKNILDTTPKSEYYSFKEVAAMKRASMDLTRSLAELRNPNVRD